MERPCQRAIGGRLTCCVRAPPFARPQIDCWSKRRVNPPHSSKSAALRSSAGSLAHHWPASLATTIRLSHLIMSWRRPIRFPWRCRRLQWPIRAKISPPQAAATKQSYHALDTHWPWRRPLEPLCPPNGQWWRSHRRAQVAFLDNKRAPVEHERHSRGGKPLPCEPSSVAGGRLKAGTSALMQLTRSHRAG